MTFASEIIYLNYNSNSILRNLASYFSCSLSFCSIFLELLLFLFLPLPLVFFQLSLAPLLLLELFYSTPEFYLHCSHKSHLYSVRPIFARFDLLRFQWTILYFSMDNGLLSSFISASPLAKLK